MTEPWPTAAQTRVLDSLSRRHGALSAVSCTSGDIHVQTRSGRRAWLVAPDGRAVSAPRDNKAHGTA